MLYSVSTNCILIQKFRKNSACLCVVYFSESFAFRSVSVNTVVKPSPPNILLFVYSLSFIFTNNIYFLHYMMRVLYITDGPPSLLSHGYEGLFL